MGEGLRGLVFSDKDLAILREYYTNMYTEQYNRAKELFVGGVMDRKLIDTVRDNVFINTEYEYYKDMDYCVSIEEMNDAIKELKSGIPKERLVDYRISVSNSVDPVITLKYLDIRFKTEYTIECAVNDKMQWIDDVYMYGYNRHWHCITEHTRLFKSLGVVLDNDRY